MTHTQTGKMSTSPQWDGDKLNRSEYAQFLTKYLCAKIENAGSPVSFTMALDAKWGDGKSFFVGKWAADLRKGRSATVQNEAVPPHVVVEFDAWAADYAQDPLMSFMSELKSALDKEVAAAGLTKAAKTKATTALNKASQDLRSVMLPLASVVGKGLLKKFGGVGFDEIVDALSGVVEADVGDDAAVEADDDLVDQSTPSGSCGEKVDSAKGSDAEKSIKKDTLERANKILDGIFSRSLSEHGDRKKAIANFKISLGTALKVLAKSGKRQAPLFIFVDELDRCRPSFAVSLLESIKHIFGVPGVCIVISTNLEQLAHTVRSVYGEGFDSHIYLKRFFDAQYCLPAAKGQDYLKLLLANRQMLTDPERGMPQEGNEDYLQDEFGSGPVGILKWVFDSFELDLRAQAHVIEMMDAAATGIPREFKIHLLWLATLCSLNYLDSDQFERVVNPPQQLVEAFHKHASKARTRASESWVASIRGEGRQKSKQDLSLLSIATLYWQASQADLYALSKQHQDEAAETFPRSITTDLCQEIPSTRYTNQRFRSSLALYPDLIRNAGHLIKPEQPAPRVN